MGKYTAKYMKKNPRKRAAWKKTLLITLIVILALVLIIGAVAAIYVNFLLGRIRRPSEATGELDPSSAAELIGNLDDDLEYTIDPDQLDDIPQVTRGADAEVQTDFGEFGEILNIMVVGQDSRAGEEHKLSDTMILCSINGRTNTMTMISFQRDLYVKLPNMWGHKCGKNRINTAYALGYAWKGELGAMQMLDQLILEQFGTEVDYNIEVNFESFKRVIDALGGIDIELNEAEAKYLNRELNDSSKYNFTEGMAHLDGAAGLEYARTRHSWGGDSDFDRNARQRNVMTKVIDKCRSLTVAQLNDLMNEILPMVLTDMSNDDIIFVASKLLPMVSTIKLESQQIPATGTFGGQMIDIGGFMSSVQVANMEKNKEIVMAICEETTEAPTAE